MFCTKCGIANSDEARFCNGCGTLLTPTTAQPTVIVVRPAKSAGLAAVLSFFWCGLGQIYNGQIGKGLFMVFAYTVSILLVSVLIGIVTTPILWIWGMVDAYQTAERLNRDLEQLGNIQSESSARPAIAAASGSWRSKVSGPAYAPGPMRADELPDGADSSYAMQRQLAWFLLVAVIGIVILSIVSTDRRQRALDLPDSLDAAQDMSGMPYPRTNNWQVGEHREQNPLTDSVTTTEVVFEESENNRDTLAVQCYHNRVDVVLGLWNKVGARGESWIDVPLDVRFDSSPKESTTWRFFPTTLGDWAAAPTPELTARRIAKSDNFTIGYVDDNNVQQIDVFDVAGLSLVLPKVFVACNKVAPVALPTEQASPSLGSPVRAEEKTYEKIARLIQVTPEDDFKPTVATLVAGELSCPSSRAFVMVMGCASELLSAPDVTPAVLVECKRESAELGCAKTKASQRVNVLKVYDLTVPGKPPDKRILAKVRLKNGDDAYVGVASMDF